MSPGVLRELLLGEGFNAVKWGLDVVHPKAISMEHGVNVVKKGVNLSPA